MHRGRRVVIGNSAEQIGSTAVVANRKGDLDTAKRMFRELPRCRLTSSEPAR